LCLLIVTSSNVNGYTSSAIEVSSHERPETALVAVCPVSEEPGREFKQFAARLFYSPHGAARSLITSRDSTLGVLLPDLCGEFFFEIIRGMDQAAQRHGYQLLASSWHAARVETEAALRAVRDRVDGWTRHR
jgi:LacI family transcriptional regulator